MNLVGKKDTLLLLLGDIASFVLALWLGLLVRSLEIPTWASFYDNLIAFSPAFILWVLVFFIFGLYDKYTTNFKRKLPDIIFNVNILNGVIALVIFYLSSDSNITPKTNLILCLFFSIAITSIWRIYLFDFFRSSKVGNVLIVGNGKEIQEIREEVEKNKTYGMKLIFESSFTNDTIKKITELGIKNVIARLGEISEQRNVSEIYKLMSSGVNIIDAEDVYESIFHKVSLSYVDNDWFLENEPSRPSKFYEIIKRSTDIVVSSVLGFISLVFYPFVYLAIKLEDGGSVFIVQERVGKNGKIIKIAKFRSMKESDEGKWVVKNDTRITRVGSFIRKSRIDELPQLWNVIFGDISLVGPRPELPKLVELYEKEIPYYNMRHLVKPGLSGWAQIHHEKPPHSIEETRDKLSYDLYYVKNKSLMLELEIALKTIKTLLSRSGV
ncbi:MAG: sugar transferase [bacterium]